MRRYLCCALALLLTSGLFACGPAHPAPITPPPPTITPVPAELAKLATQRDHWQALNIADYDIIVRGEYAFNITIRYTIIVRGGQIQPQESSCITPQQSSNQCQPGVGNQYTVPGLFDMAERFLNGTRDSQVGLGTKSSPRRNGTAIFYDPTYGFPSNIAHDLPDVYDDQVTISVTSFTRPGPATPSPATPTRPEPSRADSGRA